MFMPIETAEWTREDLERFPRDGNRYEVLDGELLVTPQASVDHQFVGGRLFGKLFTYCEAHRTGLACSPGAVIFGRNELQPDIEILPPGSVRRGKKWDEMPAALLVVEILSPFAVSRRRDLETKRDAYLRVDVREYWVVDHDENRVHVWSGGRDETIVTDVLRWQPDPSVPALEIELGKLFAFDGE